ncbi:DUF6978 family protein [Sporohalobacter salinus]|uniref:DUF6978 family protein n=1 Tax=Sporohalobacter salinus TaxID=1494606 RepID=UPI00195F6EF1|nr:hypothetical protein [Sporohalobacter salinus]MBM7624746.1 hypothetical protein [Sporohalobacter salinus]
MITEMEADRIYNEPKILTDKVIKWRWNDFSGSYKLKANVITKKTSKNLDLHGVLRNNKFGFVLLYQNCIRIRRFDFEERHYNPDGTLITGPHKHKWHQEYEDKIAYEVSDIDISDINQAFHDFLDECKITKKGRYKDLLIY